MPNELYWLHSKLKAAINSEYYFFPHKFQKSNLFLYLNATSILFLFGCFFVKYVNLCM